MITLDLARQLHAAGLIWSPLAGDRFVVATAEMQHDVFYLADMTVEVHQFANGPVVGFNGVTEWALDSVDLEDTLWLPREDQMRAVLGEAFVALERVEGVYAAVVRTSDGETERHPDPDAECAYAHALLAHLSG